MVFITDGIPYVGNDSVDERHVVARLIADFTRYMEMEGITDEQVGITFIQIGSDPVATEFLKFLDDELVKPEGFGAPFDIVDTINFAHTEARGGIVQAFIDAFND